MVLLHLQYCLMVWGNFEAGRNKTRGEALLRLQKRFVGLMAGKRGIYHADPLFARFFFYLDGCKSSNRVLSGIKSLPR